MDKSGYALKGIILRRIAVMLVLALLVTYMPERMLCVAAESKTYSDSYGTWTYEVMSDGTANLKRFEISTGVKKVIIPSEVDGITTTKLGGTLFNNNTQVESVVMPDTISKAEYEVFYGCVNITSITLSKKLERIPNYMFQNQLFRSMMMHF